MFRLHRKSVAALLIVAFTSWPLGLRAGQPPERFGISIAVPSVVMVTDFRELGALCHTGKSIRGCTLFVEERLFCACNQNGEAWMISASATTSPVMYLTDASVRAHEEMHIADIEESLRWYLHRLTSRRFPTAESCYRAAGPEIVAFDRRMNNFRAESNWKRHSANTSALWMSRR